MESLEFIGVLLIFIAIAAWYVQNELNDAGGAKGLLALSLEQGEKVIGKRSYRMKQRIAHRAHEIRDVDGVKKHAIETASSYRTLDPTTDRPRRAYKSTLKTRLDDGGETSASYKPRPGPTAA